MHLELGMIFTDARTFVVTMIIFSPCDHFCTLRFLFGTVQNTLHLKGAILCLVALSFTSSNHSEIVLDLTPSPSGFISCTSEAVFACVFSRLKRICQAVSEFVLCL